MALKPFQFNRCRIESFSQGGISAYLCALYCLLMAGCFPGSEEPEPPSAAAANLCPASRRVDAVPGVSKEHRQLDYWLALEGARYDLDAPLLSPLQVKAFNASVGTKALRGKPLDNAARAELMQSIDERLTTMRERISDGRYLEASGRPLASDQQALFTVDSESLHLSPRLYLALDDIALRCGPRSAGLYKPDLDRSFDRNNCSTIKPQESVEVLAEWPGGMRLARTRYSLGWIEHSAPLSAPLSHRIAPTLGRPLTRRAVLEEAFAHLDEPYGWGGYRGARDCSRLIMDTFAAFGINLPRFSGDQAGAGTFSVDLSAVESESERLLLLDAAAQRGLVLLYFPGHIMLYLGRNAEGEPMALHSFAEFVDPCDSRAALDDTVGETLVRIDKVAVSDLELGRGSSRGAFIERLTRLTVIGAPPGTQLQGMAQRRAPAPLVDMTELCHQQARGVEVVLSPERLQVGQPMRVIVTSAEDPGSAGITLFDPQGRTVIPRLRRLGGPPYTLIAELDAPSSGDWTIVFGERHGIRACQRAQVRAQSSLHLADSAVWRATETWNEAMENLYAGSVEALFDYSLAADLTWPDLHSLLRDPTRNILHNHLGLDEDSRIRLHPDCADLPYLLRAYFAWKMRLPFAFRHCDRGSVASPPSCGAIQSNEVVMASPGSVDVFNHFANGLVRDVVHSGNGRTAPQDDATDFYPVPLQRRAIRPGTLFADPYGHLLVVVRWEPQEAERYGRLVAADAQPDGTIGLKRFWRGTFLFSPDHQLAGAGFKAFRPLEKEVRGLRALANHELRVGDGHVPYSEEQYAGSRDDFYQAVEGMINPRPLDPFARQIWLIDALEEALRFRIVSVNNGVNYLKTQSGTVDMPEGAAIFQTVGPWENYSTPSRDMRLLIALDAVLGFPERVAKNPRRFGLELQPAVIEQEVIALQQLLTKEMGARAFDYTRSDGQVQRLTFHEIAERRKALEMAYNPNDCIEVRWAAPADSVELASCDLRAPEAQYRRMLDYRSWFASRQRPVQ